MPLYRTIYSTPAGSLTTQCYAENDEHLIEVMRLRGMGEARSDSPYPSSQPEMASTLLRERKFAAANHALVWASMIAARAQITDAWGLLNDYGLIHEMAHLLHQAEMSYFGGTRVSEEFINRVAAFEMLVPGLHSCWAGEDKSAVYKDIYNELFGRYSGMELKPSVMRGYGKSIYNGVREMARRSAPPRSLTGMTIHSIIYDDDHSTTYLMDEGHLLKGAAAQSAPSAKPGTRDFERHQRIQGGAVKAARKADLVAKMKANFEAKKSKWPEPGVTVMNAKGETTTIPLKGGKFKLDVDFKPMNDAMQAVDRSARKAADSMKMVTADFSKIEERIAATLARKGGKTLTPVQEVLEKKIGKPETVVEHADRMLMLMTPTGKASRSISNYLYQREIAERAMEMVSHDIMEAYPDAVRVHDEIQLTLPKGEFVFPREDA